MSPDFTKLIHSLKQDIQTVGGGIESGICETATLFDKSESGEKSNVGNFIDTRVPKWLYHPTTRIVIKKFMLTSEFFIFFVLFLSVLRPQFLYKNVKQTRGNQSVMVPQFSFLYLFVYSGIFTGVLHLLIFLQKKTLRALDG